MIAVVALLVGLLGLAAGFVLGIGQNARTTAEQVMRSHGIDRDTAKRYRQAAKILHDLVHVNDLDELMPILPTPMQQRIEQWLDAHNRAIREGK